jgi:glutamate N-acetyltransferase/amino-acid N-acetyltransferase
LGIIISDVDAVTAGVFTKSTCQAAPVLYSQRILPSTHVRAIVTNSGQANAATGTEGAERNWQMALAAANSVGCRPHQVLTASTGVIGQHLDIEKIAAAMPALIERATDIAEVFSLSILTTDLVPKTVTTEVQLSKGSVRITGICKGSGMIHPNMATMLGYILTDAKMTADVVDTMLLDATNLSFNMISVDGDTSTNDCVFMMANGASGVELATDADYVTFKQAVVLLNPSFAMVKARQN